MEARRAPDPTGQRGGDKRTVNIREVVNGVMYVLSRPEVCLIHRSQKRAGLGGTREGRVIRSIVNKALGRSDTIEARDGVGLEFTQEVRSYEHLGWILWSFGGREEYPELTGHQDLVQALG